MLFNSYVFVLGFLPVCLGGYFAVARAGCVPAGLWLLAASLLFYAWWDPRFLPLLLGSIVVNHGFLRLIAATAGRRQGAILAAAIAANLTLLIYFKYLATWLGAAGIVMVSPILPLGISFFTFTQIGLLIDSRGGQARDTSLLGHALFVTFFPHLIAGPILHHREIMPQFQASGTFRPSADSIAAGLGIFVIGLLKKTLLADPLAPTVAAGFDHPVTLALLPAWQSALAYSLQLYFDFSGYSDMAIGLARMFNIRFPANFNSPYKAQSVIDYWQRWHTTLTRFLTIYIYNPLALRITRARVAAGRPIDRRARASPAGFVSMVLLPTMLTITLAGVWHGSGITFLVFGLMHGVYLSVNHAWRLLRGVRAASGIARVAGRVALTYACVLAAAVVFRAPSMADAARMLGAMLGSHGLGLARPDLRQLAGIAELMALYAVVWFAPNTQQIMQRCGPVLGAAAPARLVWRPSVPWAAALGTAAAIGVLSLGGSSEFLYFQF